MFTRDKLPSEVKPPPPLRGGYLSRRSRAPAAVFTAWVAVAATVKMEATFYSGDRLGDGGRGNPTRVADATKPAVAVGSLWAPFNFINARLVPTFERVGCLLGIREHPTPVNPFGSLLT